MWELDCEESWAPKNWCFCTIVLKKTLESPLDCKEIQPVHPKGDQSQVFFERNDAKAETPPPLWPPHAKSWHIGKDSDAGRDWGQEEKGTTEDEMGGRLWVWVWVNSGSWWWTGRPGVLQFKGSQRVRHDWATELNWTEWSSGFLYFLRFQSEFGNKEFMIWATVSSQSCFCWLYRASPSLAAKNIINLILVLTIWWCSCVEQSLVLLEEGVCYYQWVLLAKLC